jgi:hypothetical protein
LSGLDLTEDPELEQVFAEKASFASRAATRLDRSQVPPFIYPKVMPEVARKDVRAKWNEEQVAASEGHRRHHKRRPSRWLALHSAATRARAALDLSRQQELNRTPTWKRAKACGLTVSSVEHCLKKAASLAFQTHWLHVQDYLEKFVELCLEEQLRA